MAFDFKGGGSSSSGAPFPSSSPGGGFRDKPGGLGGRQGEDRSSPGFQDRPGRSIPPPDSARRTAPPGELRRRSAAPVRRPPVCNREPRTAFSLPWGRLLPVLAVLALLVVCYVFRAAIKTFLMELLTWAIILLVIIFIFKWLLFGGKRR